MRRIDRAGGAALTALLAAFGAPTAANAFVQDISASTADGEGEIVVTARRRAESLQDVPISVSVVSARDIEQSSAIRISDALETVPNLYFESTSLAGSPITIRGVASNANNFGIESAVAVYVDEVYLVRPSVFDVAAADIERIEVLRGPQGTLFGRNTVAGVINITTAAPTRELSFGADLTYGRFDLRQARASLSGPLGENAGFRIGGSLTRRDGWFEQLTPGLADFNNQDTSSLRAVLRIDPAPGLDATFTFDYSRDRSVSGNNDVFAGPLLAFDPSGPDAGATTIEGRERREFAMGSLRVNLALGAHVLTSVTAYQAIDYDRFNDQDYTVLDILSTGSPEEDSLFSQEIRLTSPSGGPLTYIIGGYYSDARVDGFTRAVLGGDVPLVLGIGAIPGYSESVRTNSVIDAESLAGFAAATVDLSDALTLSGGLRITHERKRLRYDQDVTLFEVAPGVPVGIILAFAAPVPDTVQRYRDTALSGDLALTWHFTRVVSAYARFSRGYKAGGFDSTTSPVPDPGALAFGPEEVDLYEAGLKSVFAGNRARLNLALFHMDYRDKQEQLFNGVAFVTSNAASASVDGFEVEFSLRPAPGLTLNANLGFADAEYGRFVDPLAGTDFSGNRLPLAARWSTGFSADYEAALSSSVRLLLHGEASYRSRAFTTADNDPVFLSRATWLVNARAGLEFADGRYGLFAWGRNIFNERYLTGGFNFLGNTYINRNIPATWGIELRARF